MTKRHPRRTDEEWRTLIQECRTSGLTDKHWCQNHNIQPSNLYYHIRRLEEKSCNIANSYTETSEIVQLSLLWSSFFVTFLTHKTTLFLYFYF